MNYSIPNDWKEIAWNNIRFHAPADWEIASIGQRHLVLADGEGPVLEIKWGPVKDSFSHQHQLERLAVENRRNKNISFNACPVPAAWESALDRYKLAGFSWRDNSITGIGVILFCPHCRQAVLIQFVTRQKNVTLGTTNSVSQRVMASFREHTEGPKRLWAVYDMRAVLPAASQLLRYRFEAGVFELHFRFEEKMLSLYRWGLPAERLHELGPAGFAEKAFGFTKPSPRLLPGAGNGILNWEYSAPSWWSRVQCRLQAQAPFQYYRLCHLQDQNRLLGVRLTGKKPLAWNEFESLAQSYEVIS